MPRSRRSSMRASRATSFRSAWTRTGCVARGGGVGEAHAWIAGQRLSREPWQRADVTLARLRERGAVLRGLAVDRDGLPAAVVLYRLDTPVVQLLQLAAADEESATD